MTSEPPAKERPPPFRRTEAPSFRCRRRGFGRPFTVILALLTAITLTLFFLTRHKGYEFQYEVSCTETMDELLLTMLHWETASPSKRWLTGYWNYDQFSNDFASLAAQAERDGYLSDNIRLRIVLVSLQFDRRAEARRWLQEITEETAREWGRSAMSSPGETEFLSEFFEATQRDLSSAEPVRGTAKLFSSGQQWRDLQTAASEAYRRGCRLNVIALSALALGLPFIWSLLRLLIRGAPRTPRRTKRLEATWNSERVLSAWVRAEWAFLFSGLLLTVLSSLTWVLYASGVAPLHNRSLYKLADWFNLKLQWVHDSNWRILFYVLLLTGPVFLMVRWLTPGFHATLRIFGIRRCPLDGKSLCRTVLAGFSMVILLYLGFGLLEQWTGLVDQRDVWMHDYGSAWEQFLYGCLVAPFAEEFLFRGFLFTGLRGRTGPAAAAVISSLLFAIMHGYSLSGTVLMVWFGLLMCALYHRTGTLLVPMAVHALTNAILML